MITVIKRDYLGQEKIRYEGEVLQQDATSIIIKAIFQIPKADLGFVVFRQGDVFTEWFYTDRWYNIFRVESGDSGELKGWYCNITRPATITNTTISADDLALDVFVHPDGNLRVLDEDEFEQLDLSQYERTQARNALESIRQMVDSRQVPFDNISS